MSFERTGQSSKQPPRAHEAIFDQSIKVENFLDSVVHGRSFNKVDIDPQPPRPRSSLPKPRSIAYQTHSNDDIFSDVSAEVDTFLEPENNHDGDEDVDDDEDFQNQDQGGERYPGEGTPTPKRTVQGPWDNLSQLGRRHNKTINPVVKDIFDEESLFASRGADHTLSQKQVSGDERHEQGQEQDQSRPRSFDPPYASYRRSAGGVVNAREFSCDADDEDDEDEETAYPSECGWILCFFESFRMDANAENS